MYGIVHLDILIIINAEFIESYLGESLQSISLYFIFCMLHIQNFFFFTVSKLSFFPFNYSKVKNLKFDNFN